MSVTGGRDRFLACTAKKLKSDDCGFREGKTYNELEIGEGGKGLSHDGLYRTSPSVY